MNRGRARQTLFHGAGYYEDFLTTLEECHTRFDAQIHAYCLMSNHYHFLVETPRANLDRIIALATLGDMHVSPAAKRQTKLIQQVFKGLTTNGNF